MSKPPMIFWSEDLAPIWKAAGWVGQTLSRYQQATYRAQARFGSSLQAQALKCQPGI